MVDYSVVNSLIQIAWCCFWLSKYLLKLKYPHWRECCFLPPWGERKPVVQLYLPCQTEDRTCPNRRRCLTPHAWKEKKEKKERRHHVKRSAPAVSQEQQQHHVHQRVSEEDHQPAGTLGQEGGTHLQRSVTRESAAWTGDVTTWLMKTWKDLLCDFFSVLFS